MVFRLHPERSEEEKDRCKDEMISQPLYKLPPSNIPDSIYFEHSSSVPAMSECCVWQPKLSFSKQCSLWLKHASQTLKPNSLAAWVVKVVLLVERFSSGWGFQNECLHPIEQFGIKQKSSQ